MTLSGAFSGTNDGFFDRFHSTRRWLAGTAFRLKLDAREAQSWGFFVLGTIGHRLLHRQQDDVAARDASLRGYAQRAVWLTHFMDDPNAIDATKRDLLQGNLDGITVEELDAFLRDNLDDLKLGFAVDDAEHALMVEGVRRHLNTPAPAGTAPHLSEPA